MLLYKWTFSKGFVLIIIVGWFLELQLTNSLSWKFWSTSLLYYTVEHPQTVVVYLSSLNCGNLSLIRLFFAAYSYLLGQIRDGPVSAGWSSSFILFFLIWSTYKDFHYWWCMAFSFRTSIFSPYLPYSWIMTLSRIKVYFIYTLHNVIELR